MSTVEREVSILVSSFLAPSVRKEMVADFAREQLAQAQTINASITGAVPAHKTFVDGRPEAPLETVNEPGIIRFEFQFASSAVQWILAVLQRYAPKRSGRFSQSFVVLADDAQIDPATAVKPAGRYVIANTQPYARKIERGLSRQTPGGVFQMVALLARKQFPATLRIRFTYITLTAGLSRKAGRQARTPAITIELN